jgi:hypothetical protein
MNNWHNSLRKVKNCNKGKSNKEKEEQEGLIAVPRKYALFFSSTVNP